MFLPDGSRLAPVDAMSKVWTGKTPQRPVPVINSLTLAGPDSVSGGAAVEADAAVQSPTGDPLKIDWKLVSDPASYHVGGDVEATPQEYPDAIASPTGSHVKVVMPKYKGAYRLFAYVHDQHGGAAVGNIPILIAQGDVAGPVLAKKATLPLVLYGDNVVDAPYIASGWMGNAGAIKMDPQCASNPHDGKTCIQVDYTAGDSWGGVVWQSPANDWGDAPGGFDLRGAKRLMFWARGDRGGEKVSFSFGLIKGDKIYHDTGSAKQDVALTSSWKQYSIDLTGIDLTCIKTGFCWSVAGAGHGIRFYLDGIRYE
jgi:hypothetical protein